MNINSAFPSNYLKASDLGESQPIVTIDRVEIEPIGRDKEMKPVVFFQGKTKGIVLNKTNARKIAEIASSPNTEDWSGVQIKLYATEVEFGGEQVEAIRVKAPTAAARPVRRPEPSVADIDDESIPF